MDYKNKYLKYKNKYLELKYFSQIMIGGGESDDIRENMLKRSLFDFSFAQGVGNTLDTKISEFKKNINVKVTDDPDSSVVGQFLGLGNQASLMRPYYVIDNLWKNGPQAAVEMTTLLGTNPNRVKGRYNTIRYYLGEFNDSLPQGFTIDYAEKNPSIGDNAIILNKFNQIKEEFEKYKKLFSNLTFREAFYFIDAGRNPFNLPLYVANNYDSSGFYFENVPNGPREYRHLAWPYHNIFVGTDMNMLNFFDYVNKYIEPNDLINDERARALGKFVKRFFPLAFSDIDARYNQIKTFIDNGKLNNTSCYNLFRYYLNQITLEQLLANQ